MSARKQAAKQRYGETDLIGIQVSHSESLFKEGQDVILTLKDANVLDEQEDVLENVSLVDHEKASRNSENRTNRSGYSAFDEPEYDAFGRFKKKSVLSKYDEEINGLKKEAFRIGQDESKRLEQLEEIKKSIAKERGEVSLEIPKYKVASEYYTEEELITFKKPKKTKKSSKKSGAKQADDGPITADSLMPLDADLNGQQDEDHGSRNRRRRPVEVEDDLVDEAFLEHQNQLQNAIKIKLKDKNSDRRSSRPDKSSDKSADKSADKSSDKDLSHKSKRAKTESSVEVKKERHPASSDEEMDEEEDEGFQIPDEEIYGAALEEDDLQRELMQSLDKVRKLKQKERSEAEALEKLSETVKILNEDEIKAESSRAAPNGDGEENFVINSTAEFCRNLGDLNSLKYDREEELLEQFENDLKEEADEGDHEDDMEIDDDEPHSGYKEQVRSKWNEVDFRSDVPRTGDLAESKPILEEEPDVSHGLAGALQLAMKKGYLDKEIKKGNISAKTSSLLAKNYTIEEKFHDDKIGRRERYSGALSEFKEKSNYRPDVKLEYNDDTGRTLNAKEAFRVLSHKFHGKGPGKNKIDKRMKKLQQETVSGFFF